MAATGRLLLWCSFTLLAGAGLANAAAPRLALGEHAFDFGTVERGSKVEHTFLLPNRGDGVLLIDHVKSSCGCTVAVVSAHEVPSAADARVTVTVDTARMAGRVTKIVTVYTNDPDNPVLPLTMSGQVAADLLVTPAPLYLGRVRRGDRTRHEVVVVPGRAGASFAVTGVDSPGPLLHAVVEPRPDGPGQRILVELDPHAPLGRFSEELTLRTTSPRESTLTLPVFGSIEGEVVVMPPQVTFGITHGKAPERDLFIRNRGSRPLAVTGVSVPKELVTYELSTLRDGLEYRLTLRLRDHVPPGTVEGAIDIFTDDPDEGHLVVPLYAIVRDSGGQG